MARAKQTARKGSGGKAPRKQLATKERISNVCWLADSSSQSELRSKQKALFEPKVRPPGGELSRKLHAESNSMQKNHLTEKISKCIFTRFCCIFIPVQPFLQKQWQWWTRSSFMHLRKLQPKLQNWQNSTKNQVGFQNWRAYLIGQSNFENLTKPWHHVRFKPLSDWFSLAIWPIMQFQKVQKLSCNSQFQMQIWPLLQNPKTLPMKMENHPMGPSLWKTYPNL